MIMEQIKQGVGSRRREPRRPRPGSRKQYSLLSRPERGSLANTGVDILPHAPINIVETNKHFGKRWKGIRKIQHLSAT